MNICNFYTLTEYSFLSSTLKIKEFVTSAKSLGYTTLAISDDNNLYGMIDFYQTCLDEGIKPIIGIKVDYNYNEIKSVILLYAMNYFGYQNLLKIASLIKTTSQVTLDNLKKYQEGIVAIIPGNDSQIYQDLQTQSGFEHGINHLTDIKNSFHNLYFGIDLISDYKEDYADYLIKLLNNHGIQQILIHKTTILNKEEQKALDVMQAIKYNTTLVPSIIDNSFYSVKDMEAIYKRYPHLIQNNNYLTTICSVNITLSSMHYPKYQTNINSKAYLQALCLKGLEKRLKGTKKNSERYLMRLKKEIDVITKMGYADYFLIVWDFIKFAKKSEIMVGPGRGSAVSSLVAYSLGIIDIDPLEYDLIFERFLNIERVTMPDIDIDIENTRREEVINYVRKKYGEKKVATIITFTTYGIKTALSDVAKILNLSDLRRRQIAKIIDKYSDTKKSMRDIMKESEELQDLFNHYDDIKEACEISAIIADLPKNKSTHASGIIIGDENLVNLIPLEFNSNNTLQSQIEAGNLEKMGLLKIDFLALHDLALIDEMTSLIKHDHPNFKIPTVLDDYKTFELLKQAKTKGVFQLESLGMKKALLKVKVANFNELVQLLALYRPGSMGMLDEYVKFKNNPQKITYLHPDLEPILKETYGIMIYQEQIMMIARKIAGYSYQQADLLRRAIAKKQADEMVKIRQDFISRAIKNGYEEPTAIAIFDQIEKFANYGFNKSHSVAYALISYIVTYLKANYPSYFYSVYMNEVAGSNSDVEEYYKEALSRKVQIISPHIEYSKVCYQAKDKYILLPLTIIKGLNTEKVNKVIKMRPFTDFSDFVNKTKDILSLDEIERIVYSGACDHFNLTKKAMIQNVKSIIERAKYTFVKSLKPLNFTLEEYPYPYLMEKEKSVLGINIKYNIFTYYDNLYSKYGLIKISEIKPNQKVNTLVQITHIRNVKTKTNMNMAFGIMEDDIDQIDFVIFPEVYNKLNLEIGKLYIVNGIKEIKQKNNQTNTDFIIEQIKIVD